MNSSMSDYRKVWAYTNGAFKAVVQRSAEWQEFRVRLYGPEGLEAAADYHCTERSEAICTARVMVNSRALAREGV